MSFDQIRSSTEAAGLSVLWALEERSSNEVSDIWAPAVDWNQGRPHNYTMALDLWIQGPSNALPLYWICSMNMLWHRGGSVLDFRPIEDPCSWKHGLPVAVHR